MGIFGIILHGRFLRDIPLMSVYGRPPPLLIQYVSTTARVQAIEDSLLEHDHILKILKDYFLKTHKRMKHFADKRRTKRHFEVGDNVLLKLQPYRQLSIKGSVPHKLAAKYYGSDKILGKRETWFINDYCHQLQKFTIHSTYLNWKNIMSKLWMYPLKCHPIGILRRKSYWKFSKGERLGRINKAVTQLLIQWEDNEPFETTWEDFSSFYAKFQASTLRIKFCL